MRRQPSSLPARTPTTCLIALGANLGDRAAHLAAALRALAEAAGIQNVVASAFHTTKPIGGPPGQGEFLNAAVRLETTLVPLELLEQLRQIESAAGRRRDQQWGPRTLDCDLLLYGDTVLADRELTLPHPRMAFRRFVLQPAAEVADQMRHPVIGWTLGKLFEHLNTARPYIAVAGRDAECRADVAAGIAARWPAKLLRYSQVLPDLDSLGNPNRPGSGMPGSVEFLDRLAEPLAIDGWPNQPVVSDFWLDQLLGSTLQRGKTDEVGAATTALAALDSRIVQPKLLIVLSEPPAHRDDPSWRNLQQLANRPGRGPVAWIASNDRADAIDEAAAAILAMD